MKHSITLLSALVLSVTALAQPTLTSATNGPVPGTNYTLHYGPFVAPGNAGPNQTWDLSALSTDSTVAITMVQPSTVPGSSSFPGATVAETGNTATMYFRNAADGMYLVGSEAEGLQIPYSDQARYLPFPCTYQTSWADDAESTFTSEGFTVERSGTIEGEGDGYGTLIMPQGTVNNVLRIHWLETTVDHTDFFDITSVYDSYLYYHVGSRYPIVQIVSAEVTVMGNTVTAEYTQWYGDVVTGMEDVAGNVLPMLAWPNPANELVQVVLPQELGRNVFVQFQDVAGRAVHSMRAVAAADGRIELALHDVPAGLYVMSATDESGRKATVRLNVQ